MSEKVFDFNTFINEELNPAQKKAVQNVSGPLLVIAGAGSGKTRVITARITHLLKNKGVHPAQIVALTFTNKAAHEMKERIISFFGSSSGIPFVGTFHSYCLYLLKTNRHLTPFDQFSILDEDDKRSLLTKLLKKSPLYKKQTAQQLSYTISLLKNQYTQHNERKEQLEENREVQELVNEYEKEKNLSKCFDFDDLLLEAVKLFENETFKEAHQNQVRHLLVDEYQDTNVVQHTLLKHMSLDKKKELAIDSICVVGDEDQSIYSWRGATVDNIIYFKKDFKNTEHLKIEQNYRSKQPILLVANHVIAHNKHRNEKKLWSEREGRDCVRVLKFLSGYQEADVIARYCKLLQTHSKLNSTALLYRTHSQSRTIEEALIKLSIPYVLIGGVRFYERKEIKDVLAYLKLILNPFDRVSFDRAINCPARGLGDKFSEQFNEIWVNEPLLEFKQVAEKLQESNILPAGKSASLKKFTSLFDGLTGASSALESLSDILTKIEYFGYIKENYEQNEAQERAANIKEFLNAVHYFASQGKVTVDALLDEVSLLQEKGALEDKEAAGVSLMTLHAAKGLEFDNIIIPGLEENLFPSSRSTNEPLQLEEERRLFYVGITRARNRLLLTSARFRQTYGQMEEVTSSRFLHELPQQHHRADNAANWQQYEVTNYFSQWLGFAMATPETMSFSSFKPPETLIKKEIDPATRTVPSALKKHQTIKHVTFGIGIIKTIEHQGNKTIVTADFKIGTKKLDAKFVQAL